MNVVSDCIVCYSASNETVIMNIVRDGDNGIPMGWTIGVLGFDSRLGLGIFLFTITSKMALGSTQPPIQWVTGAPSLGVKRPGVKLTTHLHLVPRSKNEWSYTSIPQYAFMAWCSVEAQGQLYLYLNPHNADKLHTAISSHSFTTYASLQQ
jgi:hypothetical protein